MKASELKPGDCLTAIVEHFSASITVGRPYYVQRIENGMISFLDNDLITVWINEDELNAYFTWGDTATIESILKDWGFVEDERQFRKEDFTFTESMINRGSWFLGVGQAGCMVFHALTPTNLPHVLEALGVEKGENNG